MNDTIENRRSEERKEIRIPSTFEKNGVKTNILLVDMSEHGLGFISSSNLQEGEVLQITLTHDGNKIIQPISVEVKIQNSHPDAAKNRFGALITELQEGYQTIVKRLFNPHNPSRFAMNMANLKA